MSIDETPVIFQFKKLEQIEQNVMQVTLTGTIKNNREMAVATIKNTLLMDAYDKQSNILHLLVNTKSPKILQFYKTAPIRIETL